MPKKPQYRCKRLREVRKAQGLAIPVLACLARTSERAILLAENWGILPRSPEVRARIAEVLEADPDWLFELEPVEEVSQP